MDIPLAENKFRFYLMLLSPRLSSYFDFKKRNWILDVIYVQVRDMG